MSFNGNPVFSSLKVDSRFMSVFSREHYIYRGNVCTLPYLCTRFELDEASPIAHRVCFHSSPISIQFFYIIVELLWNCSRNEGGFGLRSGNSKLAGATVYMNSKEKNSAVGCKLRVQSAPSMREKKIVELQSALRIRLIPPKGYAL